MSEVNYKKLENGIIRDMTADEKAELDASQTAVDLVAIKLADIRKYRNRKLSETDYLANSDVTMPDNIKTWRQSLRDIPANHTDENAYDLLLARNDAGELTHSIWSKP